MSHLNVALIGYAFMGRAHSNAYRQVVPFFRPRLTPVMKVLCGRTPSAVSRVARELGWEESATDWREVIAREDVDLVDISTPGDSHADIAIAAARAGKHVVCEKPLANSVAEARRMLAAVERAGVVHMVCHNYRRAPAVMLARHLIADGRIGEIRQFRGTYLQDWIADPSFPMVWRLDKSKAGSGALGDIGAHSIDLARYLVGEIVDVAGHLETFIKERPLASNPRKRGTVTVDDAALSLVRFEGGAIGTIEATRMAMGRKNYNRFEINGSKGSLVWCFEDLNYLDYYSTEDPGDRQGFRRIIATEGAHPFAGNWWPPGHMLGYDHAFVNAAADLVQCITQDKACSPCFKAGAQCVAVLEAVDSSIKSGKWANVEMIE